MFLTRVDLPLVLQDLDLVAMGFQLLEAQLGKAEDRVHHLLGELPHGLDLRKRVGLETLDPGILFRRGAGLLPGLPPRGALRERSRRDGRGNRQDEHPTGTTHR